MVNNNAILYRAERGSNCQYETESKRASKAESKCCENRQRTANQGQGQNKFDWQRPSEAERDPFLQPTSAGCSLTL
jgi:hypothetical protein